MVIVAIPALDCFTKTAWRNVPVNPKLALAPLWLVYLALPPELPGSDQPAQLPAKLTRGLLSSNRAPSTGGATAAEALIRPYCQNVPVPGMGSAVVVTRSTTDWAVAVRSVDKTNAARPLTWGAAIDVPLSYL